MQSQESIEIRMSLQKEVVDPSRSVEDERQAWEDAVRDLPVISGTEQTRTNINGVDCLHIWRQDHHPGDTILYCHGGGFVAGSPLTHREFAGRLAFGTGINVLLIDYSLLPEHSIEEAVEDVLAVAAGFTAVSPVQDARLYFGGDSNGAALMIASMVRLRELGRTLPDAAFAISGAFDATLASESMSTCEAGDPMLSRKALEHWQSIIARVCDVHSPVISPIFANLDGLPPILLQVGSDEVWRDDSVRLARRLTDFDVPHTLRIWQGMWHVWPMFPGMPETDGAIAEIGNFLQETISR